MKSFKQFVTEQVILSEGHKVFDSTDQWNNDFSKLARRKDFKIHHGKWEMSKDDPRDKHLVAHDEDGTKWTAHFRSSTSYGKVKNSRLRKPGTTRYNTYAEIRKHKKESKPGQYPFEHRTVSFGTTVGEHQRDKVEKQRENMIKWAKDSLGTEINSAHINWR